MLRTSSALVLALLSAQSAAGSLLGGGVVSLEAWNTEASAALGVDVTVFRMYAAFDGPGQFGDTKAQRINTLLNAYFSSRARDGGPPDQIHSRSPFYQADPMLGGGVTPASSATQAVSPQARWDSYLTIGVEADDGASIYTVGGDLFVSPTAVGARADMSTEWYNVPPTNQVGVAKYDSAFGTGLYLVLMAQFTLLETSSGADVIDIRTDRTMGGAHAFWGKVGIGAVGSAGDPFPDIPYFDFVSMPTPGAGALVALAGAGCLARRRRSA